MAFLILFFFSCPYAIIMDVTILFRVLLNAFAHCAD